jgi:cytochrome b-561
MSDESSHSDEADPLSGTSTFRNEWEEGILEMRLFLFRLQQTSLIVAHLLTVIVLALMGVWISQLGGLSWEEGQAKLVFNWHPLLMIVAFCFATVASLSFRYRCVTSRKLAKLCHGISWGVAAICMIIGLIAVFRSHNDRKSGFIANLYSLHSWIGLAVFVMYLCQFLAGLSTFTSYLGISPLFKAKMLYMHYFFGPIIYLAMLLTVLTGIDEKEGFMGCNFQNHYQIPSVCKTSHWMGLLLLLTGLCTMFSLYPIDRGSDRRME